jgi:hypothetical protein
MPESLVDSSSVSHDLRINTSIGDPSEESNPVPQQSNL